MRHIALAMCAAVLVVGCAVAGPSGSPPTVTPTSTGTAAPTPSPVPSPSDSTAPPTVRPSPIADRWVEAGAFVDHRTVTQLALLGSGEVLAVGADNTCGVESSGTDTAELWDPGTADWSLTNRLPSLRNFVVLVALADGRALVTGGANPQYVAKSSTVVFDPAAREWSSSGLLDTARMELAAAALPDGRVLVAGGLLIDASQEGRALDSAEIWDPTTGAWSRVAPMSTVRKGAVATTLSDGRVLVVGGLPSWGADAELASAELYDPTVDRWSPAGALDEPRRGFALVALSDGGALVVGGERIGTVVEDGETFHPLLRPTGAERFDAASETWSPVEGWSSDTGARPAVAAMGDGRVLIVDGATATVYDPAPSTWTPVEPLPGDRYDASAVPLDDGSVLIGGGWSVPPEEGEAPGCPSANPQVWRFVPGS